jgi:two-component system sensor histidine kinase/response regulator
MTAKPLRVLIVDDSPEDQEIYQRLLRQDREHDYAIVGAATGREGLHLCELSAFDCVLLDDRLPEVDGLEFMEALARQDGIALPPVVMLTGFGSETAATDAMKAGAMDSLPKHGLSTQTLSRAIANAVEKRRLQSAVAEYRQLLEHANDELRRRDEEIRSFYHVLSHELKTPLTVIMGFLSIVLEELAAPLSDEQREYLEIARGSCEQMTLTLDDLLDVTRLETGKLKVSPERARIGEVIAQVVKAMEPMVQASRIHLEQAIAPNLPDVYIDERRIAQVLTNLLSNARKFTPAGGTITVSAQQDPQQPAQVQVAVRDTGRGIPAEHCAYIFDRLYRVPGEGTASQGGLGLGLYICRELVRLHGGEIWVESAVGEGSRFAFTVLKYEACTTSPGQVAMMGAPSMAETAPRPRVG